MIVVILLMFLGGLSDEPKLPVSDWGACPFECCVYGDWTAIGEVPVRAARDVKGEPRFSIGTGEIVKAETGVVITRRSGKVRVLKNVTLGTERKVSLEAGDILHTLRPVGEGHEIFSFGGRTYSDQLWDPAGFEQIEKPDWIWWVRIRTSDGRSGWVIGAEDFKGADACSG